MGQREPLAIVAPPAPPTPPTPARRPCTIPVEKRRLGGQVRTGQVPSCHDADPVAGQAARRATFRALQQRRGARGAAVTKARYGPQRQATILAAYYRAHPSSLEAFVAGVLDADGVPYAREVVVEVEVEARYWRLDFVLRGAGPAGADLVIEPGARYWHDCTRDAERYRVLATLGYPHVLTLTDLDICQTPEAAATRIRAFLAGRGLLPAPAPPEVAHDSHVHGCGAVHVPAA